MAPRLVSGDNEIEDVDNPSTTNGTVSPFGHEQPADQYPHPGVHRLAVRSIPLKCSGCIIQDNDPKIIYTGNWVLNNEKPFGTTHSTTARGASILFSFNGMLQFVDGTLPFTVREGTNVIVFGTVPQGTPNPLTKGPTARYILDGLSNFTTTLPVSPQKIRNQAFFAAHDLNVSIHTLEIQILQVNPKTPYILQHFFVAPHNQSAQDVLDNSDVTSGTSATFSSYLPNMTMDPTSPGSEQTSVRPDPLYIVKVLSGVLGTVIALMIFIVIVVVCRRQRVKSRSSGRIWSKFWKYSPSEAPRPDTVYTAFTTPESIMRNDPVSLARGSSAYTRSEGRSDILRGSASLGPQGHFMIPSSHSKFSRR